MRPPTNRQLLLAAAVLALLSAVTCFLALLEARRNREALRELETDVAKLRSLELSGLAQRTAGVERALEALRRGAARDDDR